MALIPLVQSFKDNGNESSKSNVQQVATLSLCQALIPPIFTLPSYHRSQMVMRPCDRSHRSLSKPCCSLNG